MEPVSTAVIVVFATIAARYAKDIANAIMRYFGLVRRSTVTVRTEDGREYEVTTSELHDEVIVKELIKRVEGDKTTPKATSD